MALNLLTNPSSTPTSSADWTNMVSREDVSNIGNGLSIRTFSLTNGGTTTKPEVAIGSMIEVGGSMYQADSDTALTDESGLADGTVHIKLVPSGSTVIPTMTNDSIPDWDSEKGGWYDGDDKFLPFEMTKAGAVYSGKKEYVNQYKSVALATDSSGAMQEEYYIHNSSTTNSAVFNALSGAVPNVGDTAIASGQFYIQIGLTDAIYTVSKITRYNATTISLNSFTLKFSSSSGELTGFGITAPQFSDGDTTAANISVSTGIRTY